MQDEKILILDFGGQYNQLIARRVRECNVYCEVNPYNMSIDNIVKYNPNGIIFTGGPNSVFGEDSPLIDKKIFDLNIPILGICYGCQTIAHLLGGKVTSADSSEYGKNIITLKEKSILFKDVNKQSIVWMCHTDFVKEVPDNFVITAETEHCPVAAMENVNKDIYAVQFHPEVVHTIEGMKMLSNFVLSICGCIGSWKMDRFVKREIKELKEKIGNGKVLCALSGGVDSSVAAVLLSKAIGKNLTCFFVDHALLRKNEGDEVEAIFGPKGAYDLNLIRINASERYYDALKGITEPEEKRKIIGSLFIKVFEEVANKIGEVDYLVQGTIYPDVIESGLGKSATIKSHHNVGGLPSVILFKEIIEPLRLLFKDEVRKVGLELGIPEKLVFRQPFPGPGLGVRIIGEITEEKVRILQDADYVFREEIEKAEINKKCNLSQYFVALSNMRSVGVMGDFRTYDYAVVLRVVETSDFMTADWARIPYEIIDIASRRIVNEVKGVNRVLVDCTSKPPSTIEFE